MILSKVSATLVLENYSRISALSGHRESDACRLHWRLVDGKIKMVTTLYVVYANMVNQRPTFLVRQEKTFKRCAVLAFFKIVWLAMK